MDILVRLGLDFLHPVLTLLVWTLVVSTLVSMGPTVGVDEKISRVARRRNTRPIPALKKMKKLCWTKPKAVIWPGLSGKSRTQNRIATECIGPGSEAPKKITGRYHQAVDHEKKDAAWNHQGEPAIPADVVEDSNHVGNQPAALGSGGAVETDVQIREAGRRDQQRQELLPRSVPFRAAGGGTLAD